MPPIRSVTLASTGCTIRGADGSTRTFRYQTLASSLTSSRVEAVADAWASSNITGCQVRFHVFTRTPLHVTVGTWNLGESISTNWWAE